ncbi:hypothetical protein [uncultured Algibacter sp.]|uniref:hypothetical protein n=1 Tax=uncultured Algibacter sp. TaxID=298659 RepID=UPI0026236823|nr:hypothetical protein [uncultured Algibacter sp.]
MKKCLILLLALFSIGIASSQVEKLNGVVEIKTVNELLNPGITTRVVVYDTISKRLKYVKVENLPITSNGGLQGVLDFSNSAAQSIILTGGSSPVLLNESLAPITVGDRNVLNSSDAQIVISRNVTNNTINGHAFSDSSLLNMGTNFAYNSYDARINIGGTNPYDHYAAFQSLPSYGNTNEMNEFYGFYSGLDVTAGTVKNLQHLRVTNATGEGAVTNQYGIYIPLLNKGTTNWALYSEFNNKSFYGSGGGVVFNHRFEIIGGGVSGVLNLLDSNFFIRDNTVDRFTFERTTGDFTATGTATAAEATVNTELPTLGQVINLVANANISASSNFAFGNEITGDVTVSADWNGKLIDYNGSATITITIPDNASLGLTDEAALGFNFTVDVNPANGGNIQFVYSGSATGDTVQSDVTEYNTMIAYIQDGASTWRARGNCIAYTPLPSSVNNVYTEGNALSATTNENDVDGLQIWFGDATISPQPKTGGGYKAQLVVDTAGTTRMRFDIPNLMNGATYNFNISGVSSGATARIWDTTHHSNVSFDADIEITTTEGNHTGIMTASADGAGYIIVDMFNAAQGTTVDFYNLTITVLTTP